jgi:hypothetical protein
MLYKVAILLILQRVSGVEEVSRKAFTHLRRTVLYWGLLRTCVSRERGQFLRSCEDCRFLYYATLGTCMPSSLHAEDCHAVSSVQQSLSGSNILKEVFCEVSLPAWIWFRKHSYIIAKLR